MPNGNSMRSNGDFDHRRRCGGPERARGRADPIRATLGCGWDTSPILEGQPVQHDCSTARRPRRLVSARITPLRLEAFEQLPKHARRCVFWEVDPATLGRQITSPTPNSRRKRGCRWSCSSGDRAVRSRRDGPRRRADGEPAPSAPCLGYVLLRPAARGAAGAAVSHRAGVRRRGAADVDAASNPDRPPTELPHSLIARVVDELVRRGVRALEAFGRTASVAELASIRAR